MELDNQPTAVIHFFSKIEGKDRYSRQEHPTGRVRLLFDGEPIGGYADDTGPHWYVLENRRTLALNPSYRAILEHFGFDRTPQDIRDRRRYYWRVPGAEGMWLFKRAVEEITGVRLPAP